MAQSTILNILHKDHQTVAQLFKDLENTTARNFKRRQEIFHEIDLALTAHAEFEEREVYPLLAGKKTSKMTMLEAEEEHLQVKRLLAEIREMDPQDDRWMAKALVLIENVTHHVKEEEDEVFSHLRKDASAETLNDLAQDYKAIKEETEQLAGSTGAAKSKAKK